MRKSHSSFMNFKGMAKKASAGFLAALLAMGGLPAYANGNDKGKKPKPNIDSKPVTEIKKLYKRKMDLLDGIDVIEEARYQILNLKGNDNNLTNWEEILDRVFCDGNDVGYVNDLMKLGSGNIVKECEDLFESIGENNKLLDIIYTNEQNIIPKKRISIKLLLIHDIGTLHRLIEFLRMQRKPFMHPVRELDSWLRFHNLPYAIECLRGYIEGELKLAFDIFTDKIKL